VSRDFEVGHGSWLVNKWSTSLQSGQHLWLSWANNDALLT